MAALLAMSCVLAALVGMAAKRVYDAIESMCPDRSAAIAEFSKEAESVGLKVTDSSICEDEGGVIHLVDPQRRKADDLHIPSCERFHSDPDGLLADCRHWRVYFYGEELTAFSVR